MALHAQRWRVRRGWETEAEGETALRLARRFRGVWHKHDRAARRRCLWRRARRPLLAAMAVVILVAWALGTSPWPAMVTLRHYVASFNCALARMVGLSPAMAGQPGYWDR